MLTPETNSLYGLNDRVGHEYMAEKDRVVGNKFLPLYRLYKCPGYNYLMLNLIIVS